MTTLSELLVEDKSVWDKEVSTIVDNIRLSQLIIVDGEVIAVHINSRVGEDFPLVIERDASYDEEDEHFLFFLQELFFVIDNFEYEFSVSTPLQGGYELSCLDDDKGYLHQRYVDYSYAEAREEFIEYVTNYRVPFY